MVNQKKKRHSSTTASSVQNGTQALTNGVSQKNGTRDVDEESLRSQASRLTVTSPASPSRQLDQPQPISNPERESNDIPEPSASCSSDAQTSCPEMDAFIAFAGSSEWDRVESMCEMVAHLNPFELRLLSACVEGAVRSNIPNLKHIEFRANQADFIENVSMNTARMTYPETVEHAFMLVSLMTSTNRKAAFSFVRLIDKLLTDRVTQLPLLPEHVRVAVIQKLGKLVSAALHHPAFSVDQRIRLANARDDLRNEAESLPTVALRESAPSPPPVAHQSQPVAGPPGPPQISYIKKIKATADPNGNDFIIELLWNDGLYTWVHRSRAEIASLHHRLLDLFGEERRDETPSATAATTPTALSAPANQSRLSSRILTYFNPDGPESELIDYINGLSDLPARMMLCPAIFEEFYASRSHANGPSVSESIPRVSNTSPPLANHCVPSTAPQTFVAASQPLIYGPNANNGRLQVNRPSCSNCGGEHSFVQCDKPTILEVTNADGKQVKPVADALSGVLNGHGEDRTTESPTFRPQFPPGLPIQTAPYPMIIADPNQGHMFFPVMQFPMFTQNQINNNN